MLHLIITMEGNTITREHRLVRNQRLIMPAALPDVTAELQYEIDAMSADSELPALARRQAD